MKPWTIPQGHLRHFVLLRENVCCLKIIRIPLVHIVGIWIPKTCRLHKCSAIRHYSPSVDPEIVDQAYSKA